MSGFPRTTVGGVSVSRMIIGTNWFLGFSHTTAAKDAFIKAHMDRKRIADVIETFVKSGVDTIMGLMARPLMAEAVREAEDRTGKRIIVVSTPGIPTTRETPARGFDPGEAAKVLDEEARLGVTFCFPHQGTTDALVDRCTREIRHLPALSRMIRERGMIPGLSTHMPESIIYADETGVDVETYIAIYNSMGFLMQVEVDWIAHVIRKAKKPVMTIKPLAAGRLLPPTGLAFVWNTIRDCDMVTLGCMTPYEAEEGIELSRALLERRNAEVQLQTTRSKQSLKV